MVVIVKFDAVAFVFHIVWLLILLIVVIASRNGAGGRAGSAQQLVSIRGPLVRANDELAEELVAQAVEVVTVELCVVALLEVFFYYSLAKVVDRLAVCPVMYSPYLLT